MYGLFCRGCGAAILLPGEAMVGVALLARDAYASAREKLVTGLA
jgi:hypothetical protein